LYNTNCGNPIVNIGNNIFNVGWTETRAANVFYPRTKFKFRMINGDFELYKNDVLVGTLPYDNTKEYIIQATTNTVNTGGSYTNTAIQLIRVEGNFQ
jgi:hypothetical protein